MNSNSTTALLHHSHTPVLVSGLGLVTPLGWNAAEVWQRLCAGESGIRSRIELPVSRTALRCARVENFDLGDIVKTGRVRRSSAISHFAVGAAALALRDARLEPHPRIGVIVAVTMGVVRYSRMFHTEFIQGGARNVSPMLFPETVFNAPASHVAAVFGLTDTNYTVIGDACSAANALAMACDLIAAGPLDQCLVVATEELDWIMIEAYRRFGLLCRPREGMEMLRPFDRARSGFLGGEGATALLVESSASAAARGATPYARLLSCDRGYPFHHRRHLPTALRAAVENGLASAGVKWSDLGGAICSANGTFVDAAEATVLAGQATDGRGPMPVTSLKAAIGESLSASCLFQIAAGALAIRHRRLPPTVGTRDSILDGSKAALVLQTQPLDRDGVLVLCVGFNEQASVVILAGA